MTVDTVTSKLNELKKMIRDISVNEANDGLTEFILLTAMTEIELRKGDVNKSAIRMRIDEAIRTLREFNDKF